MNYQDFINLISFCILMEHNGGIREKSPRYVLGKFKNKHPGLLGYFNSQKLQDYRLNWELSMKDMDGYTDD